MVPGFIKIVTRSIVCYKKPVLYQILIISLLSAVITGSFLTGSSVRKSLKRSALERIGNTGFVVSSGVRYFDASLADRMNDLAKVKCTGILEINGYCQSLTSQKSAFNTHIYGVNSSFFRFNGNDSITIFPGEIAVNRKLADNLDLKKGDELIVKFSEISDIPSDSPFAPAKNTGKSVVMKIGQILQPSDSGNFALSISQIIPMNIFINLS